MLPETSTSTATATRYTHTQMLPTPRVSDTHTRSVNTDVIFHVCEQNFKMSRHPNEYRNLRFYLNKIPLVPDGEFIHLQT